MSTLLEKTGLELDAIEAEAGARVIMAYVAFHLLHEATKPSIEFPEEMEKQGQLGKLYRKLLEAACEDTSVVLSDGEECLLRQAVNTCAHQVDGPDSLAGKFQVLETYLAEVPAAF